MTPNLDTNPSSASKNIHVIMSRVSFLVYAKFVMHMLEIMEKMKDVQAM